MSVDLTRIDTFQIRLLEIIYSNSSEHITLIETNPTVALLLILEAIRVLVGTDQYQNRLQSLTRLDPILVARITTQQLSLIPASQRRQDIAHFLTHGPYP